MGDVVRGSPLAVAILGVLAAGPLHPYGIQQRLKQWGKEAVVNVGQRASLYKTIARLESADLVVAEGTSRNSRYPERSVYSITLAGSDRVTTWLSDMIANPRNEYPDFPAALSFAPMFTPPQLQELLTARRDHVAAQLDTIRGEITALTDQELPAVTLLDDSYREAMLEAELSWINHTIGQLDRGVVTWTRDQLRHHMADPG